MNSTKWADAPTEEELALLRPVSEIHRRIQEDVTRAKVRTRLETEPMPSPIEADASAWPSYDPNVEKAFRPIEVDPGQDEGSKVTIYVKSPSSGELTEVSRVDAAQIAGNVTGGSVTITGVEPGEVLLDERGFPVGVVDDRSVLVRSGLVQDGQFMAPSLGAFGAAATAYMHWGQSVAAAAEEMRQVMESVRQRLGEQSWPTTGMLVMSDRTWHTLTHTVKRGREAIRWIQSLTPAQRSNLRLISTPQSPVLSPERAAKKQRRRERAIRALFRSYQRL